MTKQFLLIILSSFLLLFFLSACSSNDSEVVESGADATNEDGLLVDERIQPVGEPPVTEEDPIEKQKRLEAEAKLLEENNKTTDGATDEAADKATDDVSEGTSDNSEGSTDGAVPGSQELSKQGQCENAGGSWIEFPNGCADSCTYVRNPGDVMCTMAFTYSCDCPENTCWNGDSCEQI